MVSRHVFYLLCAFPHFCCLNAERVKVEHEMAEHQDRRESEESTATCEQKLDRGDKCQVFLALDEKKITFEFDAETTLADVRKRVQEWVTSLGGVGDVPDLPLSYKSSGAAFKVLEGDAQTLLSLGVMNTGSIPDEIVVSKGALKGGVMYGKNVKPEEYDFVVNIFYHGNGGNNVCTGTIYGKFVLTAAHCLYNRNPQDFHIMLAHVPAKQFAFKVKQLHVIPGYDPAIYGSPDVGVIEVDGQGSLDDGYFPKAKVQFMAGRINLGSPMDCYMAGYGVSEHGGEPSPNRPLVVGKFVANQNCIPRKNHGFFTCASSPDYTAGCGGDSGGPWFVANTHFFGKTEYQLFGVHHGSENCDPNRPNSRDTSDIMLLSESVQFWGQFFPQS